MTLNPSLPHTLNPISMLWFLWRLSLRRCLINRRLLVPLFIAAVTLWLAPIAQAGSIRPGFDASQLARNDDGSSSAINIGFTVNFFGENFNQLYVNNNGNMTFGASLSEYSPEPLDSARLRIIAPFWADVDTRHSSSGVTKYGIGTVNERAAFGATWINVGYYSSKADKLNSFQVIIVDRSDVGVGDFDIEFNYDKIQWETGDASSGSQGFGGKSAHAGYSNGREVTETLPGSGINGAVLDGGQNSLVANRSNFSFIVRDGKKPEQVDERISLKSDGMTSVAGNHTVIATLMDHTPEKPIPVLGREMTFEVIEGPNAGYTGKVRTNANGQASFTYTVSGCVGIDKIQASFVDLVGNRKISNIVSRTIDPTAPVARFTVTPNPGIIRQTVTLDGSSASAYCEGGRITSYQWQSDDGQAIPSSELSSITYAQAGTYTITLTVTDDLNASHSTSQTITVSEPPPPVARIVVMPISGDAPLTVVLDGSSSTAYSGGNIMSYQWSSYGEPTTTSARSSITYTQPGHYEMALTVTDNLGMTNTTTSQTITVVRSNQEALINALRALVGEEFTLEDRSLSFTTADGETHHALLSDHITPGTPSTDLFNLALAPIADANHDGIEDLLITYPSGDQQVLYYFGTHLGPSLGALRYYFEQTLGTDAIIIKPNGSILLTINDVLYEGQLDEVAEETLVETPKTGFLQLVPYTDVDNNEKADFVIVYPNGVQQILFNWTLPLSDKIELPPPVETEINTVASTAEAIYAGENPVQKGVDPTAIDPDKVAILRGNVTDRDRQALFGVIITVEDHPEWGRTNTLRDGTFTLAVNGGELVTLNYLKPGYLVARRQVQTAPNGFFWAEDVVMTAIDWAQGTLIDLSPANTEPMQVAQGQVITTPNRPSRQPTLFFPLGTRATFSNGTQLEVFELQITEYTINDNDLAAMPAPLPADSGYTYAVNISVDGRTDVRLSRRIPFYLTNFLGFPVGSVVPVGRLDEDTDRGWVPAADGRVIKVLTVDNGIAGLDTNGNGLPDEDLGITVAEKQEIAKQFPVDSELWRIEVNQLGDYDLNWPLRTPRKLNIKHGTITPIDNEVAENPTLCTGCIIDAESYVLKKSLPVTGVPFNLHYRSDRTPGRTANYDFKIPLQDNAVATPKRIQLEVSVWGQKISQVFSENQEGGHRPLKTPIYEYKWDGQDGYGRNLKAYGRQQATVRIGYIYGGIYEVPSEVTQALIDSGVVQCATEAPSPTTPDEPRGSFGCIRVDEVSTGIPARQEVTSWQEYTINLGAWVPRAFGLGGWTLAIHHTYDPNDKVLYQGDGEQRQVEPLNKEGKILIASKDGGLVYEFNQAGTHQRTLDSLTNQALYTFSYLNGYLVEIQDIDGNLIRIERDDDNKPLAIIAPYGQRTELRFDSHGYLASITNPLDQIHQMVYTETGLLTEYTDPRGHKTEYNHTDIGFFEKNTDPVQGGWALEHHPEGNGYTVTLTSGEDRVSTATVTRLDDGTFQQVNTAPDGTQTVFTRETTADDKKLTTLTQADGTQITLLEGPEPERFEMQSPLPEELTVETPAGLVATLTTKRQPELANENDPLSLTKLTEKITLNGRTSTRVYEAANKTLTTTSAADRRSVSMLDDKGRVVLEQTPELADVRYEYDDQGRLIKTQVGEGDEARITQISYDSQGYVNQITDSLGREFKWENDATGRVTQQTLPDGREIRYGYDDNGNLIEITSPGQPTQRVDYTDVNLPQEQSSDVRQTRYEYNLDKELTKMVRPDAEVVEWLYEKVTGRLNTIQFPTGQKSYFYDSNNQISRILLSPDNSTLSYAHDGFLPLSETWGNGHIVAPMKNVYNNSFQVVSSQINGLQTVDYRYDADDLLIEAGFLKLVYSTKNRLLMGTQLGSLTTQRTHTPYGKVASEMATYNKETLYQVQYRYDNGDRITEKVESLAGGNEVTYTYRYDDLTGDLLEVTADGVTTDEYHYDSHGNRLSADTPNGFVEGRYDDQARLVEYGETTYEYTVNGECLKKNSGGVITAYEYDVFGNLRRVKLPAKEIEYSVDGEDRRIGKWVDGEFIQGWLYHGRTNPIAALDRSGNLNTRFVYGSKTNVPDYMIKDNRIYRILTDHLGSPRLVVELDTGTIVQRLDYDVFGNVIQDTNPGFQPFGFAGGLYDVDTGLVRLGKRDYDAETGQWTALEDSFSSYVRDTPIEQMNSPVLPTTAFLHLKKDIFNILNSRMLKATYRWEDRKRENREKGLSMTQDDLGGAADKLKKLFNIYREETPSRPN